jgi:hypothetical protein
MSAQSRRTAVMHIHASCAASELPDRNYARTCSECACPSLRVTSWLYGGQSAESRSEL